MPLPVPVSRARATGSRTVSFASVTEGGWMPATQFASALPSSRSEASSRSPCGTSLTFARTTLPEASSSSSASKAAASAAATSAPRRNSRTAVLNGSPGWSRRSCTARSAAPNEIRPAPRASSTRSVGYPASRSRARSEAQSPRSSSDLDVLLDVPAGPLGPATLRAVLDLDPAEVERDQLGRRLGARFLVERAHEYLGELDLQVLERLLAGAAHAQGRLLEVLPGHARQEELRRGLVREHREVERLEARSARAAAAFSGSPRDVDSPAEGDELDLALVLGVLALALDAVDLQEVVHCGFLNLVDQLPLHGMDRDPPENEPEHDQDTHAQQVGPAVVAEDRVADELDALVQRVDLREVLGPLRQAAQREERAGHEEERRQHRADDVVEVLERRGEAGDHDPEARPAEAREPGDERHGQHPPGRVEPERSEEHTSEL